MKKLLILLIIVITAHIAHADDNSTRDSILKNAIDGFVANDTALVNAFTTYIIMVDTMADKQYIKMLFDESKRWRDELKISLPLAKTAYENDKRYNPHNPNAMTYKEYLKYSAEIKAEIARAQKKTDSLNTQYLKASPAKMYGYDLYTQNKGAYNDQIGRHTYHFAISKDYKHVSIF